MKSLSLCLAVLLMTTLIGCGSDEATPETPETPETATPVSLTGDVCGKCGDIAGTETCCKGETCSCGMQKGSALCCSGVESSDVVYCKDCGFGKGTDECCSDDNTACTKCGLAAGSDLCCKVATDDSHEGHDHDHGDEG
ncbi:MAG: hypothetical protein AAFV88_22665 [Planctomycetota bacterium]